MSTYESDVRAYNNFHSGSLKPATTRGVVVSTEDPLYSGRVKVWVPAIHGPSPYGEDGLLDPENETSPIVGVQTSVEFKNAACVAGLPWAKVLSQNLGPTIDFTTGITNSSGCFTTPAVGTEVILIFENNDPGLPIVIGSIIHANEFRYSLARPIEYLPGVLLSDPTQTPILEDAAAFSPVNPDSYASLVSSVYNIRTGSGSTLFISDSPTNKTIVLEGAVAFSEKSTLTPIEEQKLSRVYPAFPTTASAAFAKRTLLALGESTASISNVLTPQVPIANSTTIIIGTNIQSPSSEAIDKSIQDQAGAANISKSYPLTGAPRFTPGTGLFGAARGGGTRHIGIDIHAEPNGSTILLAPIDCYPMYMRNIEGAGIMLIVLGVDKYAHAFLHERSILPNIADMCRPGGKPMLVKRGTPLGVCGINERTIHNRGAHLHWEVFNSGGAKTGQQLNNQRESLRHNVSNMISGHEWLKFKGDGKDSILTGSAEEIQSYYEYSALTSSSSETEFAKPAGLEMSLTPGKESIMLRHPSGSFIGFDPDGNILIYSCGDINFRVNRSITYDVFGAIMENAYAKFSRIKTVIKNWSRVYSNKSSNGRADTTMPEFFTRVEQTRALDMVSALGSNIGNSLILDSNGNFVNISNVNPVSAAGSPLFATPPMANTIKNYQLQTWDTLIKEQYQNIIKQSTIASMLFPDMTDFKALMLLESDGNDKATSSAGAMGLFQIKPIVLKDVLKRDLSPAERTQYYLPKDNIEIAFKYIIKLIEYVRKNLVKIGADPAGILSADYKYLVLLAYNQGPTKVNEVITMVKQNGQPITYKTVEAMGTVSRKLTQEGLQYVPTFEYIKSQTPILK